MGGVGGGDGEPGNKIIQYYVFILLLLQVSLLYYVLIICIGGVGGGDGDPDSKKILDITHWSKNYCTNFALHYMCTSLNSTKHWINNKK